MLVDRKGRLLFRMTGQSSAGPCPCSTTPRRVVALPSIGPRAQPIFRGSSIATSSSVYTRVEWFGVIMSTEQTDSSRRFARSITSDTIASSSPSGKTASRSSLHGRTSSQAAKTAQHRTRSGNSIQPSHRASRPGTSKSIIGDEVRGHWVCAILESREKGTSREVGIAAMDKETGEVWPK